MQHEFDALIRNGTYDLVPLPSGKITIGCKWLFSVKLKAGRTLNKYKAILVAKGCFQIEG